MEYFEAIWACGFLFHYLKKHQLVNLKKKKAAEAALSS
jgi:hypothetical protein